jgi:hypothetical protein
MLRVLIGAALLLLPLLAGAAELRGIAKVVDGDTLRIEGIPVRLNSIDAPETDQLCQREGRRPWLCGDGSTEALRMLAEGREVAASQALYHSGVKCDALLPLSAAQSHVPISPRLLAATGRDRTDGSASVHQPPDYEPGDERDGNAHQRLFLDTPFRSAQLLLPCGLHIVSECHDALAHRVQFGLRPVAGGVLNRAYQGSEILA